MSHPYNALHTFHLIVRFGNLKRTAEHLNVTESAVSHQIKRLEIQLGYSLFYKSGRQLKITPEGNRLATELTAPFEHIDQALNHTQQKSKQAITIYCLPSLIETWLLPRLLSFKQAQADYDVIINYHSSAPEHLDEHCLRIGSHEKDAALKYPTQQILVGETLAVCSPIYLSRHGVMSSSQALLEADLLHDHSAESWRDWFAHQGLTMQQPVQVLYEDFHLLKMATLAAQGVALCPPALIQTELNQGRLVVLSDQSGNIGRYYAIEHNKYAHVSIRTLVKYLTDRK